MRSSSLFSLVATVDVVVAGLLTRSCDRLVMTGWGHLNFWRTCLGPCLRLSQKSPDLFSSNQRSQNVRCHQWNCCKTHNSCVIILKSRLILQVILPACTRFVTFSLIDDSQCAHTLSTTVPIRNITIIQIQTYYRKFYHVEMLYLKLYSTTKITSPCI